MAYLLPNDEVSLDKLKGYLIFLWAHDHPHPKHVHFRKSKRRSGWDLDTEECTDPDGFSLSEITQQSKILKKYRAEIWRAWNAHWEQQNSIC